MNDLENKMSEENPKKLSWWQVLLLILTALLIVGLILVNFLCSENRFVITGSIVTLICLLIVIVLSNSFDSFSIVGIFNLRREVKENKEKIDKLENLMFQSLTNNIRIVNNSSSKIEMDSADEEEIKEEEQQQELMLQSQHADPVGLEVQRMDSADKEKIKEEEQQQEEKEKMGETRIPRQRLDREEFAKLLLRKYCEKNHQSGNLLYDMKISDTFISNRSVSFKAYIKDDEKELFIDTFQASAFSFLMSHDRIYVKISKILNYRSVKNTNAKMVCLIGKPDFEQERFNVSKLQSDFLPAISNNLRDIVLISYSQAEYDDCLIPRS